MYTHNRVLILAVMLVASARAAVAGDDPCPCPVTGYTWLADPCNTWNCAASALIMANGDPHVLVLPSASKQFKWVVLRRAASGSVAISPDAPFVVESFPTMAEGNARFSALENADAPLLVTSMDGNVVVIHLRQREVRTPAVNH